MLFVVMLMTKYTDIDNINKQGGGRMDWGVFRYDKAIEVLLYILSKDCRNMYNVLKVAYFADKEHMRRVGSTICKDRYIAMRQGPVPSGMYDLCKAVRNSGKNNFGVSDAVKARDPYDFVPLREPDMDFLSDVDIQCLDESIEKYGQMPFGRLKDLSHAEPEYKTAGENDEISFVEFVKSVDENGELLSYLKDILEEVEC